MSGVDLSVDFKAFQEKVSSSLVNSTRTAGQISNEDLGFHRTSSGRVSKALDEQNTRLLRLTNKLLKAATEDSNLTALRLADADSIDDNWRKVVDVVDDMLEKADASLDEFSGVIKRFSPAPQDGASTPPTRGKEKREVFNIFQNASMPKPQRLFDVKPNNYETKPFRPLLKTKPHAIKSLVESIGEGGPNGYGLLTSHLDHSTLANISTVTATHMLSRSSGTNTLPALTSHHLQFPSTPRTAMQRFLLIPKKVYKKCYASSSRPKR
jgi:PMC2NT (NUC016) domain